MLNNIKTKERGFTIVELLIVIVVIAILAAISIVAYNGIQNRGKASAAQSLGSQVAKKAEAYNTVQSSYPDFAALTATTSAVKEAQLDDPSVVVDYGTGTTVGTAGTYVSGSKHLVVYRLTSAAAGGCVYWWDYAAGTPIQKGIKVGSGTC